MKKDNKLAKGTGIGIIIGSVIGVLTDNIALWLSLGLVFGAGYGKTLQKKEDNNKKP